MPKEDARSENTRVALLFSLIPWAPGQCVQELNLPFKDAFGGPGGISSDPLMSPTPVEICEEPQVYSTCFESFPCLP